MPMDKTRYPPNWNEISRERRERAGWRCEWCGIPNGIWVYRKRGTAEYLLCVRDEVHTPEGRPIKWSELLEGYDYDHPTKIVLSVAHLGVSFPDGSPGDKHNKFDIRDENLAALCQRCHLLYDIDEHVQNRKTNLNRKKRETRIAAGQLELFIHKKDNTDGTG